MGSRVNSADLASVLSAYRVRYDSERQLQDRLAEIMSNAGIIYSREVRLTAKDRIDFMIEDVGMEVKINMPTTGVIRQLYRYAQCAEVLDLVLVTSRAKHREIPREIAGKPLHIVFLDGWL